MAGLSLPQGPRGYRSGSGRSYSAATRPEEAAVIPRPTIRHSGVGLLIDENLRKQQAFKDRHESVPSSFIDEMRELLASLGEQNDED